MIMFLSKGFKLGFAEDIISVVAASCKIFHSVVVELAKMVSLGMEA